MRIQNVRLERGDLIVQNDREVTITRKGEVIKINGNKTMDLPTSESGFFELARLIAAVAGFNLEPVRMNGGKIAYVLD